MKMNPKSIMVPVLMVVLLIAGCGTNTSTSTTSSLLTNSNTLVSSSNQPSPANAQELQSIDFGVTAKTATEWPTLIADSLGFFEKNGIKLNYILTGSSAAVSQQLAAGSINIGGNSSTQLIQAVQGGAPIKYVLSTVITAPYTLVAQKDIKTMDQLKGKTIIIGGETDITHYFLDTMLRPNGLKPEDYALTFAGATNNRYAALQSGSVAAALLFPPFDFLAVSQGYNDLGNVQKYLPSFLFTGYAVNTEWAKSHSDLIVSFIKGYLEGLQWLYNSENKSKAIELLKGMTNTSVENGEKTYDALITKIQAFSQTGKTEDATLEKVINALVELKQIKAPLPQPAKFYDNQYIELAASQSK
jgi:ABC-type nitrate/sulfonate/bicarbonate transport system substrate-binding protein